MLLPHPLDIVAILLGIFLALRKSEVRAEEPSRHGGVSNSDFERWRTEALAAYSIGLRACFAKVLLDYAFLAVLERVTMPLWVARTIGGGMDAAWVLLMLYGYYRQRRARKLAVSLGIYLGGRRESAPDGV